MSRVYSNGRIMLLILCSIAATSGLCIGDVVINEVEISPPDNGLMWVELFNTGEGAIDLSGWTVKIEDKPWIGTIDLKGVLEPKGFLAFDGKDAWEPIVNATVYLYDNAGNEVDKTPMLSDDSKTDFTYGRLPDGKKTNSKGDFAFMMGSKGRSNSI